MISPANPSPLLTNLAGLSDSIASLARAPELCPVCRTTARIRGGECLSCLLTAGEEEENTDSIEKNFATLLEEIDLPDTDWRLGNYQILEEIGRGGMGVIYRARQRHSKRVVALKRVLSYHGDSRETLERFRREAEAAASLDHPNILPIYEVGEADGLPFFTMKYASGGTLQEAAPVLRNDPRECVRLLAKVTRAVAYAHREGILHRDLKPANILLDSRGEPMVSDFGLAKWIDATSDLTRSLAIFGTPGFIAPEQASGARASLTPAADIYSLGAILFDLLGGRPPFLGEHALAVIGQARDKAAPKLRTIIRHVDRDLETICAKCLEREPGARYRSAHGLAEDLEHWLEGRPIIARPVSPPTKVWRWSKRNPMLAVTLSVCAALATAAVTWQIESRYLSEAVLEQAASQHSIAVLPFLDLDQARLDTNFGSQIASSLESKLRRHGPSRVLSVVSQDTSAAFSNVANIRLAARSGKSRAVLSGTYRTVPNGVRVSLRLTDAEGNLLVRRIETIPNLSGLAGKISEEDTTELYAVLEQKSWEKLVFAQQDPAFRNERARDLLLAGRELTQRPSAEDLSRAIDCFQKALAAEPSSVLARTELARAVTTRTHYQFDEGLLALASKVAHEAAKLDPLSGEAHRALASVLFHTGRPTDSLEELFNFVELSGPDVPAIALTGSLWRILGHPDKALTWFTIMAQWQRRPAEDIWIIGDCWSELADDAKAEAIYRRASELYPHLSDGWVGLCHLKLLNGDFDGARTLCLENKNRYPESVSARQMAAQVEFFSRNFKEAERLYGELLAMDPAGGGHSYGAVCYQSALGLLHLTMGVAESGRTLLAMAEQKAAAALISAPDHPTLLYQLAAIEASQNKIADAIGHLVAAKNAGWLDYRSMILDPRFDRARLDPRFQAIAEEIKETVRQLNGRMENR